MWWPAAPAGASWASSASGPAAARSTTVAPPTGLSSSCGLGVLSARITLDWSATPTAWADGYEVWWGTSPGSYTASGTPTPALGLSFATPNLGAGTYYFAVRATKGSWRGGFSNQVSRSIGVLGCVL